MFVSLMKLRVRSIAVLGSGLMGTGIACLLAGCGFEVILLDLPADGSDKNSHVSNALDKALSTNPSPIYHKKFSSRISIGNFEDDLFRIKTCDWILEAVLEDLDIKKKLYQQIEMFRSQGTLISSNTSGIPIHLLADGRSDDFRMHFLGTHFFNPPRYLNLLEIIPGLETNPEVVDFFMDFGSRYLGKQTVMCKDTPGFIANRIGVFSLSKIHELTEELGISISEADKITGMALGRPKSGSFRLMDLIGVDTAAMVAEGLQKKCPQDQMLQSLRSLKSREFLLRNKWFGNKSGKGFYVKSESIDEKGKPVYLMLNLKTLEYETEQKSKLESIVLANQIEELPQRLSTLLKLKDAGALLLRKSLGNLFAYASQCIPEITDTIYSVDHAMKNGYAWEQGPFETWDLLGFETGLQLIEETEMQAAQWIYQMKRMQCNTFYILKDNSKYCIDINHFEYIKIPGQELQIQFALLDKNSRVFQNDEMILHDIGDGVLGLEFISKHNAIGEGILQGIQESIRRAEEDQWKGIVIANNAKNFSVGANLMLIGMMAFQQEYKKLDEAIKLFQQTSMRCRYSSIPIVVATQGYVFGGGLEITLHCDAAVCAVESYIGLVEAGVGLIPGGGGSKEFAARLSNEMKDGEVLIPQLIHRFKTIATAAVATSAFEAFDLGYLDTQRDAVSISGFTHIQQAKQKVLQLAQRYIQPVTRNDIKVLGRSGLATLYVAANSLLLGKYASEHDIKIARKLAYVLCGGDLSYPQLVTEQYLLDLEREAFLSLCTEPKTLERIQYLLEHNKPLRN